MATSLYQLKQELQRARDPGDQYTAAIHILQYCLPNPSVTQHPYWTNHDKHITTHLRQFIQDECKEGTVRTLDALNDRLQHFDNTFSPQAPSVVREQLNYLYTFMALRPREIVEYHH